MKIRLVLLLILFVGIVKAQNKKFKNEILYKQDSTIYNYKSLKSNSRTKLCKEILMHESAKKDPLAEIDWQVEKETLLENDELIVVKNTFLTRKEESSKFSNFLFESTKGKLLGPYASDYGSFRFVKISYNTSELKASWGLSGDGLDYSWILLSKEKGTSKQLKAAAQKLIDFYKKGKGNYDCVHKKIKRFQADKKGAIDFIDSPKNKKEIEQLSSGEHYLMLNHPRGLAILGIDKRASGYESVRYTEYIFK